MSIRTRTLTHAIAPDRRPLPHRPTARRLPVGRPAASAGSLDGAYVSLGAGANWLDSQKAQRTPATRSPIAIAPDRARYDIGARLSGSVGYGFGNGLRLELEGTALGNSRKKRKGPAVPDAVALTNGQSSGYEADAGLFLNVLYEADLSSLDLPIPVSPYVGLGVGYLRTLQRDIPTLRPGSTATRVTGDRDALGVQAIVGAAFPIEAVPGLALTVDYRATTRTGGKYDATIDTPTGTRRVRLNDDAGINQAVLVGLRYAFNQSPPPAPPVAPAVPIAAGIARSYLVFFDWDRADLSAAPDPSSPKPPMPPRNSPSPASRLPATPTGPARRPTTSACRAAGPRSWVPNWCAAAWCRPQSPSWPTATRDH